MAFGSCLLSGSGTNCAAPRNSPEPEASPSGNRWRISAVWNFSPTTSTRGQPPRFHSSNSFAEDTCHHLPPFVCDACFANRAAAHVLLSRRGMIRNSCYLQARCCSTQRAVDKGHITQAMAPLALETGDRHEVLRSAGV